VLAGATTGELGSKFTSSLTFQQLFGKSEYSFVHVTVELARWPNYFFALNSRSVSYKLAIVFFKLMIG
jgi:hypothetical protein